MRNRLAHWALSAYYRRSAKAFRKAADDVEGSQRRALAEILRSLQGTERWNGISTYEQLRGLPLADYNDFSSFLELQRSSGRPILSAGVKRYEPTSGSTHARKWIPYTEAFLREINRAAAAWMGDVYGRNPAVSQGLHYWSLSWVPEELREAEAADTSLFPWYQRILFSQTMLAPEGLSRVATLEASWWATLLHLAAAEDLSLISVWSPTFLLKAMDDMESDWDTIQEALQKRAWLRHERELSGLTPPRRTNVGFKPGNPRFWKLLWPKLSLLSAWDSSSSRSFAESLSARLGLPVEGKGLWATEAAVSFPFEGKKVLAVSSHFYEFKEESGLLLPAWEVQEGKEYQPVVSTGSGLLRYQLPDRVRVTGRLGNTPCLEFLGRIHSTDLVGEKIAAEWVEQLFRKNPGWQALALLAVKSPAPHYVLAHQGAEVVEQELESALRELYHYQLARSLKQLEPARCLRVKDAVGFWDAIGKSPSQGRNKPEILLSVPELKPS